MFTILIQALWFLLPAGVANMTPVGAAKLFPGLNFPMDFYLTFKNKRVFGEHKTMRGFVTGVLASIATVYLQRYLYINSEYIRSISLTDYSEAGILLGLMAGAGALLGDAAKSFAKRQVNILPGKMWFPFDQTDWIVGTIALTFPFFRFSITIVVVSLICGLLLHILSKFLGYIFRLNETPI
ncbi:CDP-archaeol synthase [candidate division WWE3 bacterium]|jgi:CDP-2,3-bis-(O-geranylgeranyl)-sn-glycerol synthase|uniref:CDP-archaeol synthase n=1 Tax=candidate division WWE3 bacterium TaxID=2053526 RepID=A0A3A4ZCM2_UNCKA|nr:MAG: CDP-archaeol synthase [candidate division WWE3 bacterium]